MPQKPEVSQWWLDDNIWLDLLKPVFLLDPRQAHRAASLFRRLIAEIEKGPGGVKRVSASLQNATGLTRRFIGMYSDRDVPLDEAPSESYEATGESENNISDSATKDALSEMEEIKEAVEILSSLHVTPQELLQVILKIALGENITYEQIRVITTMYDKTVRIWYS